MNNIPETPAKPWYASKTLWVNLVALVAMVSAALGLDLGLTAEVQAELAGAILALVNVALRLVTRAPIGRGRSGSSALLVLALPLFLVLPGCGTFGQEIERGVALGVERAGDAADSVLAATEQALCSKRFSLRAYEQRFHDRWDDLVSFCRWDAAPPTLDGPGG